MGHSRPVGRHAGAIKYDILTAIMALGVHDAGTDGRLARRLALLITARFNWIKGSFAVGTREIAQLWGVTDRTAKRELSAMRGRGWIIVRRPAARGRVTEYTIDLETVLEDTRCHWPAVGPDFVARMGAGREETPPPQDNVIPFDPPAPQRAVNAVSGGIWDAASERLRQSDPDLHAAWFAPLVAHGRDGAIMELGAPSRFAAQYLETHFAGRLLAALSACDPGITRIRLVSET